MGIFEIEKVLKLLNIWVIKRFEEDRSSSCLFNGCTMKPIGSHSISESRILKKISVDNHVWFYTPSMEMGKRSIKDVSVFGGFCCKHDSIFYPIDNNDYIQGDKEREFLFFYRAFCRAYSIKSELIKIYQKLIDFIQKYELSKINPYFNKFTISSNQKFKIATYFEQEMETHKIILQSLSKIKDTIDYYYAVKRFDRVKSFTIEFNEEYNLAVAACFNVGADFNGNSLPQDVPMSLTVFPQNGRTYNILSFLSKNSNYFGFLKTQLVDERKEWQKTILSYYIANCTDNFAFSPAIWDKFSDKTKKEFKYLNAGKAKNIFIDCEEGLNLFVPIGEK